MTVAPRNDWGNVRIKLECAANLAYKPAISDAH